MHEEVGACGVGVEMARGGVVEAARAGRAMAKGSWRRGRGIRESGVLSGGAVELSLADDGGSAGRFEFIYQHRASCRMLK